MTLTQVRIDQPSGALVYEVSGVSKLVVRTQGDVEVIQDETD